MRVRLGVAALVNNFFINVEANIAAGTRRINMGILFTSLKLPSIHFDSVPRSRSKGSIYSYPEKNHNRKKKKNDSKIVDTLPSHCSSNDLYSYV